MSDQILTRLELFNFYIVDYQELVNDIPTVHSDNSESDRGTFGLEITSISP